MLTPRERVLRTLRHEHPGLFPKDISFTPAAFETFRHATGSDDPFVYFGLEVAHVGPVRTSEPADYRPYFDEGELPEDAWIGDYGIAEVPSGFYHFTGLRYPAKRLESVAQWEEYPWPTWGYPGDAADTVARWHEKGYAVGGWTSHIWEVAWQVRSMDRLMLDFIERPDMATYLLDRIADNCARCAAAAARAGCDVVMFGDDVGMQDRLMMSPAMWREWFFPRLKRSVDAAKAVNPNVHIWYHSDGDIRPIIPGLMDAGVNVLNPVQPECMDPKELRAEYGKHLAFWGCVGTQTTFPFGTPDDMRRTVLDLIETVGASGGLLLAPTHVVEPEVPWENIAAFFAAIDEAAG